MDFHHFHDPCMSSLLKARDIPFALGTSGRAGMETRFLALNAAQAAGAGLDQRSALLAVTLWPARILDVADRIGSLEKGKDADIVILDGSPLDSDAAVFQVLINGQVVFSREE